MSYTLTPITIKDASGTNQTILAYTDGTQSNFSQSLLDNTGALISPATSGLQTTGNTSLATIATNTGHIPAVGSAVSASSLPVVIASDQGLVPVGNNIAVATSAGFARPANTTAYAAGYLVANNVTAGSVVVPSVTVARANNIGGFIPQIQLKKNQQYIDQCYFQGASL